MSPDASRRDPIGAHPRIRERRDAVEGEHARAVSRRLVVAGVGVLALLLAAATTQSPLLDVDEVRVVGTVRLEPEEIREVASLKLGTALLGLDLTEVERRILELPDIAEVTARKDWGGVVTVEVAERVPVARIIAEEGTIVVAGDGMVLDVTSQPVADLPVISGAMFSVEPGDRAPLELTDAIAVAAAMPSDVTKVVERIELTVDTLVLRLVGGGSVALGDARDLEAKFDAVRAFLLQVDLACLDTLDVRAPTVPVIVRSTPCRAS